MITNKLVKQIQFDRLSGMSIRQIAAKYNISYGCAWKYQSEETEKVERKAAQLRNQKRYSVLEKREKMRAKALERYYEGRVNVN
jgi:transposase